MHRSRRFLPSLVLALLALGLAAPTALAAGPGTVTVRVVGESTTLLPLTTVALGAPDPGAPGCSGDSANAALNSAIESVGGTWDHGTAGGSTGDFTETILGETHIFEQNETTWAVWVNDRWGGGICEDILEGGEELLLVADYEPAPAYAPTRFPLVIEEAPATVTEDVPFTVRVGLVHTRPGTFPEIGEGTVSPEEGVRVSTGSSSALTNAKGEATLVLATPGSYTLGASKGTQVPSAPASICVLAAGASVCGEAGSHASGSSNTKAPITTASISAPYKGPYALVADVQDIANGRIYTAADAPRLISGTIRSHSAVNAVKLELRREYRGRCYAYDGIRERFVRARCATASAFTVSNNGSFSYLLPERLKPGRYVLDVHASDVAGNVTTLARGSSRLVFYVR
jgi:hypothetical protein